MYFYITINLWDYSNGCNKLRQVLSSVNIPKKKKMKKTSQEPVKVVLTYKAAEKDNLHAKVIRSTVTKTEAKIAKASETMNVVRRYSFDDNGGGYLGL